MSTASERWIRVAPAAALLVCSACSTTSNTGIRPMPHDLPQQRVNSYDPANRCVQRFAQTLLTTRRERILFLIDSLPDLAKNSRDWTSGPLSFAGGVMLADQLTRYGGPSVVLQGVPSREVRDFVQLGQEFGVAEIVKLQRQYNINRIFLLDGGFVGYDQARTSNGRAGSGSYRNDNTEIQAETGSAMESGRIDFILKITDVITNRLLGTISLSSTERRRSASAKFTLQIRGVGGGFASQNVEVDGSHGVQASIIAAAHFYLWQMILPGDEEGACIYNPSSSPSVFAQAINAYEVASPSKKVRMLQSALNQALIGNWPPLVVDGSLGPATLEAIGVVEQRLRLAPAARSDYATLYANLLKGRRMQ